ncbi:MAG: hypothetical protein KIT33_00245 [Candidatus Kapabacteria bacterium]|nr:hypothetical protein [Candidatus Kapabacteria bacterium]
MHLKHILRVFIITILLSQISISAEFKSLQEKVNYFKNLYKVDCLSEKITDNFGNGFESLYGTRNMRTILYGIAYRGGSNNFYHKTDKRDNHNPLPPDGLNHLCMHGFSNAVYLYSKNFATADKIQVNPETGDTLYYHQNSGNDRKDLKVILLMVKEVIDNPDLGPLYLHCWNGWHQSGYVSAATLMQFCNFSNEEAYNYWMDNTDGVNKGYDNVKKMVRNFKKFDDISIDEETRKLICPCTK